VREDHNLFDSINELSDPYYPQPCNDEQWPSTLEGMTERERFLEMRMSQFHLEIIQLTTKVNTLLEQRRQIVQRITNDFDFVRNQIDEKIDQAKRLFDSTEGAVETNAKMDMFREQVLPVLLVQVKDQVYEEVKQRLEEYMLPV
jgi:hypothetical protein